MLAICANSSFFSSCKLTIVLRRFRRFLHVWFTAPPLFRASLSSSQSCSKPLAWPALHTEKALDSPDLRLLRPWPHTPLVSVIGCWLASSRVGSLLLLV